MSSGDIYKTYDSLRRHIILFLCLAGLLSLVLVGGTVYYEYRSVINEKATERLVSIVLKHKGAIDNFLSEISTTMRTVTLLDPLETLRDQEALEKIFRKLEAGHDYAFEDLGVINAQGDHLSYIGPHDLMTRNYKDSEWFKNVMQKDVYISNVFLGFRHLPHFIVAVRQGEGDRAWVLRATVNADRFGELVEYVRFGKTGHAYLMSYDGYYQTRSRDGQRILDKAEDGHLDLSWFEGVRYWQAEHDGKKVFMAKTWMKDNEWLLVVEQEVDDVFGEFQSERNKALVFFFGGAAFITLLTVCTIRVLIRKVSQADAERHMVDEQLLQAQKLASIGQLSSSIAHEINNPMAIIGEEAGWLQDILKRAGMKEFKEYEEFSGSLNEIVQQAGRCREITHKLLSFARKMDFTIKDVDMNTLLDEVVSMREREASLNNIHFVKEYQQELPLVYSEPSLLRQVFLNLINNAVDAIKKGGGITIKTGLCPDKFSCVVVVVSDTGMGIPQENLDKIFDPFFTTKAPGKGTGLGLSICHGIVKKLGGDITVASQVGQGATFTVKIPIEPPKNLSECNEIKDMEFITL